MKRKLKHVIAFDDAPFPPERRGDIPVAGVIWAGGCVAGVLATRARRDGSNATAALAAAVGASRHHAHLGLILLQGIALAGFNVVDIQALAQATGVPVLSVVRRRPDLAAVRRALLARVPGGARKWRLVERAGPAEPVEGLWVQRAGVGLEAARDAIRHLAVHGRLPEPLRLAHLVAGALGGGESRHRA